MTDKPSTFDLNKYTFKLLQADPFFASLSRRIQKRSSTAIPTAGVRLNKDTAQFEMLYNPQFFEDMSDKERLGVLKHEFYHIIFEHVTGRLPPEGMSQMWNVATDLAINSHLNNPYITIEKSITNIPQSSNSIKCFSFQIFNLKQNYRL